MIVQVRSDQRLLEAGPILTACEIGRNGTTPAALKREGDGRTPAGEWPILTALIRPGRGLTPPPSLPWRWPRPDDGWCDAPGDPASNRSVRLPYPASAERMWRDDIAYDAALVLAHNLAPPVPAAGSAIFLHLSTGRPTEGCVAIAVEPMAALLGMLMMGDRLRVV